MSHGLLVLGWHNIEPTWAFPRTSAAAGRKGFERQIAQLSRWANVVPLRPTLADLAAGRPLPPRAVALTFDDGYLDNATVAAPMLAAAGLPATFFLVPDFLSGTERVWWEDLGWGFTHATATELRWEGSRYDVSEPRARRRSMDVVAEGLKVLQREERFAAVEELLSRLAPSGPRTERKFMNWDEARSLLDHGHDIQSHTCGHPILSREDPAVQAQELGRSRRELEVRFERPVDVLAFPNGSPDDYSETTVRLAAEAGYSFSLTTVAATAGPRTHPHEVPRLVVDPAVHGGRLAKRTLVANMRARWADRRGL